MYLPTKCIFFLFTTSGATMWTVPAAASLADARHSYLENRLLVPTGDSLTDPCAGTAQDTYTSHDK